MKFGDPAGVCDARANPTLLGPEQPIPLAKGNTEDAELGRS